jgi:hypothetical protein
MRATPMARVMVTAAGSPFGDRPHRQGHRGHEHRPTGLAAEDAQDERQGRQGQDDDQQHLG